MLDHERATGAPWDAQAVTSAHSAASGLLKAQAARMDRRRPVRSPEVKNYTRGLESLHKAGLVQAEPGRWSKRRAALCPALQMYAVAAGEEMPEAGEMQLDIVAWMEAVEAPTAAQCKLLRRLSIDPSGLSRSEAVRLQQSIIPRFRRWGLRHHDLVWLLDRHSRTEHFAARCLAGEPHECEGLLAGLRSWTRSEIETWREETRTSERISRATSAPPARYPGDQIDLREAVERYQADLTAAPSSDAIDIDDAGIDALPADTDVALTIDDLDEAAMLWADLPAANMGDTLDDAGWADMLDEPELQHVDLSHWTGIAAVA